MNPNLKTFVLSVIKPLIISLRRYSEAREKNIERLVNQQNALIYQNEMLIAELNSKLLDMLARIDEYNKQLSKLTTSLYTLEDVQKLDRRMQEVNYMLGTVYDLIYTKLPDANLPDIDEPWIPGDPVKTEEELEAEWRAAQGIDADQALTPEQAEALQAYIDDYYKDKTRPA